MHFNEATGALPDQMLWNRQPHASSKQPELNPAALKLHSEAAMPESLPLNKVPTAVAAAATLLLQSLLRMPGMVVHAKAWTPWCSQLAA